MSRTALRLDVGQLLVAGISGPELTELERAWLRLLSPAGIILFRRNIESSGQVHALLSELRAHSGRPGFRAVDLEGGLVDRLRDLLAPMPSAAAVGQAIAANGKTHYATEHGRLIGRSVRILGFNTTFAPVLDLPLPESAAVMRTRVVPGGSDAVVTYARKFLRGLAKEQVLGCGKHFPGLGGGTLDSHIATPAIDRTYAQIWAEDLLPYRELRKLLPMVMISHARYPVATPKDKGPADPASVSPFWIGHVLKRRLGYRGLVLSDDMEMGGILEQATIEEAAVQAIAAGTHLIEICKDPALVLGAYEALLTEAERSPAFRAAVEAAARTVRSQLRHLLGKDAVGPAPTPAEMEALRGAITSYSNEVHQLAGRSHTPEANA